MEKEEILLIYFSNPVHGIRAGVPNSLAIYGKTPSME